MTMRPRLKLWVNTPAYDFVLQDILAPPLLENIRSDEEMDILEIGCGRGGSTVAIRHDFPNAQITAVDIDPAQLKLAKWYLAQHNIDCRLGDHCALGFDDSSFDLVIEFNTIHHVRDWRRGIQEACRVLRSNGLFAIGTVTERFLTTPLVGRYVAPKSVVPSEKLIAECRANGMIPVRDRSNRLFNRLIFRKS